MREKGIKLGIGEGRKRKPQPCDDMESHGPGV